MDTNIDRQLAQMSDTSVLLNFAGALESLFPHMKVVRVHCYDPYDDVVEPLFWALVYGTFSEKYGVSVPREECHGYEFVVSDRRYANYVRIRPRELPLTARRDDGEHVILTGKSLAGYELVFINFGDGIHFLTDCEDPNQTYNEVRFHLTRAQVLNADGPPDRQGPLLWLRNDSIEYEFVHVDAAA